MHKLTLVIGNKNYSSWSLRPWLLLRHFGQTFIEVRIPLSRPDTRERLQQYSPSLKVPVLIHEHLTIWDSLAICEYASEQLLDGRGWPQGAAARASARSLAAEMHSGFAELRNRWPMNIRLHHRLPVEHEGLARDIARVQQLWRDSLQQSGGPWLFGEFGIVDAMFAPVVLRFHSYQPELVPESAAYMQTMLANSALQDWITDARNESEVIEQDEVQLP